MRYTLRNATNADRDSMMRIAHEGLRPYVEELWGWVAEEQEEKFRIHFEPESVSIVQVDGVDVGYFKIEEQPDHVFLAGIYLHADYRQNGLGTQLVSDLIQRCEAEEMPLRLQILKPNPAKRLYRRLGFQLIEETDTRLVMQHGGLQGI